MASCGISALRERVDGMQGALAEQLASRRQDRQEQGGALVVAHLFLGQQHRDGAAPSVADRVELRVQSASGPAMDRIAFAGA